MNLETGKKEAKLLSDEDRDQQKVGDNRLTINNDEVVDVGVVDASENLPIPVDEIEEGLKRVAKSDDTSDTIKKKFRTMEELKK